MSLAAPRAVLRAELAYMPENVNFKVLRRVAAQADRADAVWRPASSFGWS